MFDTDLNTLINDLPVTMSWENPSGTTETPSVTMSAVFKDDEMKMPGEFLGRDAEIHCRRALFADSDVYPQNGDTVTIASVEYRVIDSRVGQDDISVILRVQRETA
jgi:hypothetical protein